MITKKYKDEIFAWDPSAFGGKGYWYVLGTKGGLGRAASRKEAKFLGKPLENIADTQVDKDLEKQSKEKEQPEEKEEEEEEKISPRQIKRMRYERARVVRRTGLSDLITSRLVSGQGITRSVAGSIGDKFSARLTGLKQSLDLREKLDPLNIAKFLTGGSSLGPALLGRLLGRKQEDIEYFSGFGSRGGRRRPLGTASLISSALTGKKITPLPQDGGVSDVANELYGLFSEYFEQRKKENDRKKSFEEENKNEEDRRHQEIIDALVSLGAKKPTATKIKETSKDKPFSIVDTISDMFGLGRTAIGVLKSVGLFFTGPVGLAILGATSVAALGYFFYKAFTSETAFEAKDSELSKGIKQAETVGGLAGVKDEADRRKKLPEYEKTMQEIKDYEKLYNEGQPLNDKQLESFRARGKESNKAVEDYIKETRPKQKTETVESPTVPPPQLKSMAETVQSGFSSLMGNMEKVAEDLRPQMESMASALQVPMAEAAGRIENIMKENVDLQMLESKMQEIPTILNNVAAAATAEKTESGVIGSNPVRNDDDSIMRAMRQSFRTV